VEVDHHRASSKTGMGTVPWTTQLGFHGNHDSQKKKGGERSRGKKKEKERYI